VLCRPVRSDRQIDLVQLDRDRKVATDIDDQFGALFAFAAANGDQQHPKAE
jgi:hypothetical protein